MKKTKQNLVDCKQWVIVEKNMNEPLYFTNSASRKMAIQIFEEHMNELKGLHSDKLQFWNGWKNKHSFKCIQVQIKEVVK